MIPIKLRRADADVEIDDDARTVTMTSIPTPLKEAGVLRGVVAEINGHRAYEFIIECEEMGAAPFELDVVMEWTFDGEVRLRLIFQGDAESDLDEEHEPTNNGGVTSLKNPNRLGLEVEPCEDGKSERIVGIDPDGRVALAQAEIAVGDVLINIGGMLASKAKSELAAGKSRLSAGKVSLTILKPGAREPMWIELPALDETSTSMESETVDKISDDPLYEIAAPLGGNETQVQMIATESLKESPHEGARDESWGPENIQAPRRRWHTAIQDWPGWGREPDNPRSDDWR
jgi:hypothetical protein